MSQNRIAPFKFILTAAVVSVVGSFCSDVWAASDGLADLKLRLQELRSANSITLMIVPYRTHFSTIANEYILRHNSCTYEIKPGPDFAEVLNVMENAIIEYQIDRKLETDLRVGIVFNDDSKVMQEFYFNDTGGFYQLRGFSGNRRIAAKPTLPSQLRSIVAQPSVKLVKANQTDCRHR